MLRSDLLLRSDFFVWLFTFYVWNVAHLRLQSELVSPEPTHALKNRNKDVTCSMLSYESKHGGRWSNGFYFCTVAQVRSDSGPVRLRSGQTKVALQKIWPVSDFGPHMPKLRLKRSDCVWFWAVHTFENVMSKKKSVAFSLNVASDVTPHPNWKTSSPFSLIQLNTGQKTKCCSKTDVLR